MGPGNYLLKMRQQRGWSRHHLLRHLSAAKELLEKSEHWKYPEINLWRLYRIEKQICEPTYLECRLFWHVYQFKWADYYDTDGEQSNKPLTISKTKIGK